MLQRSASDCGLTVKDSQTVMNSSPGEVWKGVFVIISTSTILYDTVVVPLSCNSIGLISRLLYTTDYKPNDQAIMCVSFWIVHFWISNLFSDVYFQLIDHIIIGSCPGHRIIIRPECRIGTQLCPK